ncbi:hypothetical protein DRN58_08435, partial [Thermococci archaeon]
MKNKYCNSNNLHNESDVEQFFIMPLLKDLGFTDDYIRTKKSIFEFEINKGKKRRLYKPDYILYLDKKQTKPIILIDAKHPHENSEEGVIDSQMYTAVLRRELKPPKPEQYCIGTNGIEFIVKHYDSNKVILKMKFGDFNDKNEKYKQFLSKFSLKKLQMQQEEKVGDIKDFELRKPTKSEINGIFRACHNLIWKKEKIKPTEAFYEFSKLFFVKLYCDRELHKLINSKTKPKRHDIIFSVDWIESERADKNPINNQLFRTIREKLEEEIENKNRKRIFSRNEQLNLKPSTIKEVVRLLEHLDLFGINEDLNGRMFETFLSATIRGKDLGQFFTPRKVVEFMTKLADLKVGKDHIDTVLDACCGTGGFLIEAMSEMFHKVDEKKSWTDIEKEDIKNKIVRECLWGVDADKSPYIRISRVARMNMYFHGDGSNRIYWVPDSLDKKMIIEEEIDRELKNEAEEFKQIIESGFKFDVVLTNPPFSMRYESSKEDERKILEDYEIAYKGKTQRLRASLKSNVLFLERYHDLLKPHGKLITIIDESVLNANREKDFRDFI